jgi:hypothetical protein
VFGSEAISWGKVLHYLEGGTRWVAEVDILENIKNNFTVDLLRL